MEWTNQYNSISNVHHVMCNTTNRTQSQESRTNMFWKTHTSRPYRSYEYVATNLNGSLHSKCLSIRVFALRAKIWKHREERKMSPSVLMVRRNKRAWMENIEIRKSFCRSKWPIFGMRVKNWYESIMSLIGQTKRADYFISWYVMIHPSISM